MMKLLRIYQQVFLRRFCQWALRATGIGATAVILLLCSPLLPYLPEEQEPRAPEPVVPEASPRVGVTLRRGDTLLSILNRYGLKSPSAHDLIDKLRPLLNLRRLRAGDNVKLVLHPEDKSVQGMEMAVEDNLVLVKATTEGWLAERREIPFVRETRVVRGTITDSLYQSGVEAGLSPQQILDLARIFEYDIDFFSDFQAGDSFAVAVEDVHYEDGRRVPGRIAAAELEAGGEFFNAFYFVAGDGSGSYYNGEGQAVRRSFLRAPLSYTRISSPFSLARRHPIFRTLRPHRAIDYAAPTGTPVVAIGRGQVEFSGWRNGYGNFVEVRHAGGYVSRYGHFSRIAAGIRKGVEVDQGEVVGYVGQTGHATGPHLHFEFLRHGEKINFLALKIPRIERLAGNDLQHFRRARDESLALLHGKGDEVARVQAAL
jgi:murein DD-endopeptidase MepM/ murein hydrolase activator NlpD